MKFQLVFKTPDVLDYVDAEVMENQEALNLIEKYVKYSAYVTIEFDTELKTATVIEKPAHLYTFYPIKLM